MFEQYHNALLHRYPVGRHAGASSYADGSAWGPEDPRAFLDPYMERHHYLDSKPKSVAHQDRHATQAVEPVP